MVFSFPVPTRSAREVDEAARARDLDRLCADMEQAEWREVIRLATDVGGLSDATLRNRLSLSEGTLNRWRMHGVSPHRLARARTLRKLQALVRENSVAS